MQRLRGRDEKVHIVVIQYMHIYIHMTAGKVITEVGGGG